MRRFLPRGPAAFVVSTRTGWVARRGPRRVMLGRHLPTAGSEPPSLARFRREVEMLFIADPWGGVGPSARPADPGVVGIALDHDLGVAADLQVGGRSSSRLPRPPRVKLLTARRECPDQPPMVQQGPLRYLLPRWTTGARRGGGGAALAAVFGAPARQQQRALPRMQRRRGTVVGSSDLPS